MLKSLFKKFNKPSNTDLLKAEIRAMRYELADQKKFLLEIHKELTHLNQKERNIMTTLAEILAKSTALDDAVMAYKALKEAADAHVVELMAELQAALANAAPADQIAAIEKNIDMAIAAVSGAQAVMANTGDNLGHETGPSAPDAPPVAPPVVADAAPVDPVPVDAAPVMPPVVDSSAM